MKRQTFRFFVSKIKNLRPGRKAFKQKSFKGPGFDKTAGQRFRSFRVRAKGQSATIISSGIATGIGSVGIGEGVRRATSNKKPKRRR